MGIPILNFTGAGAANVAMEQAIRNFGGLFIHSAGNSSTAIDNIANNSAQLNLPNQITVGATTSARARASFSNWSSNFVDIYASGVMIISTIPIAVHAFGYQHESGTSMAAPHVAGVAAMIYARFPGMNGARLRTALLASSSDIWITTPDSSPNHWANFLDAYAAVNFFNATAISTPQQLNNIRNNRHGNFFLTQNIDMSSFVNWTPIPSFYGHFDGRGFVISNLRMSIPDTSFGITQTFGLFGVLDGAVNNVIMQNISIVSAIRHGGAWTYVGAVAGRATVNASISNVGTLSGRISIDRIGSIVGGIVGVNYGVVRSSASSLDVRGNGYMGGVVGVNRSSGRIFSVTNAGHISFWLEGTHVRGIGGIVGLNSWGIVSGSGHMGLVSTENIMTAPARMGTIIGHNFGTFDINNFGSAGFSGRYTWSNGFWWIGGYNNGVYLFTHYSRRVGRQG